MKDTNSVAVLDAFMAAHADKPLYMALAEERKKNISLSNIAKVTKLKPLSEILPEQPKTDKPGVQDGGDVALLEQLKIPPKPSRGGINTIESFFDFGKSANDGNTIYALFGPPNVELTPPAKNAGNKTPRFSMSELAKAPALEALVQSGNYSFNDEAGTNCRLDWLDRCPFLPQSLVQGLTEKMSAAGMDINEHSQNYFQINRIAGS